MALLFVNACIRGEASRTFQLCRAFLEAFAAAAPGVPILEHNLVNTPPTPIDPERLAKRETLCDNYTWNDPMIAQALDLQQAEAVLIGAPYWDLSFPSVLKVWVENVFVRNLTFRYENDIPIGLCQGKHCVYLTTSGSPIAGNDWGTGYIRATMDMLGLSEFSTVRAEGLDLMENDADALLRPALQEARLCAQALAQRL